MTATLTRTLADDLDAAFPDLVTARQDAIYSGVLRFVRDHGEAADLTQETFVRAYRALRGYERDRILALRIEPWLWTIALNLCRNRHRKRVPEPAPARDEAASAPGPEEEVIRAAEAERWNQRLDALTTVQRVAVVLRHVVGLTYEEIAAATGRPAGTVKADVHRGLAKLRTIIEGEESV